MHAENTGDHTVHEHHHPIEPGWDSPFKKNDMVRVMANHSLHGFNDADILAIIGTKTRSDGSYFHIAVNSEGASWGVTDEEIEMVEAGGLLRFEEGDVIHVE